MFGGFLENQKAWRHGLVYPIYVPGDLSNIRSFLSIGNLQDAVAELWKLSSLGSPSAVALLQYMCLRDAALCGTDRSVVEARCRESAHRRNCFAQYVMAWSEYEAGNHRQFAYWLNQSARHRFAPAMGDVGRSLISTPTRTQKSQWLARRYFQLAIRRGHFVSISTYMHACKRGAFGPTFQAIGIVGWPLSILLMWPVMRAFPFGMSVFAYPVGRKKPLFNVV